MKKNQWLFVIIICLIVTCLFSILNTQQAITELDNCKKQINDYEEQYYSLKCNHANTLLQNKLFKEYIYPYEKNDTVTISYFEDGITINHSISKPHQISSLFRFYLTQSEKKIDHVESYIVECGEGNWWYTRGGEYWFGTFY